MYSEDQREWTVALGWAKPYHHLIPFLLVFSICIVKPHNPHAHVFQEKRKIVQLYKFYT